MTLSSKVGLSFANAFALSLVKVVVLCSYRKQALQRDVAGMLLQLSHFQFCLRLSLSAYLTCSPEELTRLLNDKDAYNAFLHSLDEVSRLDKVSAYAHVFVFSDKDIYRSHLCLIDCPLWHWRIMGVVLFRSCMAWVLFASILSNVPFYGSLKKILLC